MKDRFEFYNMLILLLDNGVQLNSALQTMYEIFSDHGKKRHNIIALVCEDSAMGIREGKSLADVLQKWVTFDEISLIKAGEESGDLQAAFKKAKKIIETKKQVIGAVATCTVYPSMLALQAAFLMHKVSVDLIPKLGRSSNPDTWDMPARSLKMAASFVNSYGAFAVLGLLVFIAVIFVSMPTLNGPLRYYLDKVPPWSIYRTMHGSTFLQNVGVMLNAGVPLTVVLQTMASRAAPWLKRRIEDALHGVNIGSNLGDALYNAGHEFPDKRAIHLLRVISGHNASEQVIEEFGTRWLAETVINLQKTAKVLLGVAISINAAIMLWVLVGASGMQDGLLNGVR